MILFLIIFLRSNQLDCRCPHMQQKPIPSQMVFIAFSKGKAIKYNSLLGERALAAIFVPFHLLLIQKTEEAEEQEVQEEVDEDEEERKKKKKNRKKQLMIYYLWSCTMSMLVLENLTI